MNKIAILILSIFVTSFLWGQKNPPSKSNKRIIEMKGAAKKEVIPSSKTQLNSNPSIYLDSETYNFGKLSYKDENYKGGFFIKVKNIGNSHLILTHAGTSDGGTFATAPREPISPGSTDSIFINIHRPNSPRKYNRPLYIYSNDPIQPTKNVSFKFEFIE